MSIADLGNQLYWTENRDRRRSIRPMTRSKELRRIERAIQHRDETELQWATEYCRMRLHHIRVLDKRVESRWRKLEKRIREALGED